MSAERDAWEADYESMTRRGVSRDSACLCATLREFSRTLEKCLTSPAVRDDNGEPANAIDVIARLLTKG